MYLWLAFNLLAIGENIKNRYFLKMTKAGI